MLKPTIKDLTKDQYNRYELTLATAKAARQLTDEYVRQREEAEKVMKAIATLSTISIRISRTKRQSIMPSLASMTADTKFTAKRILLTKWLKK